MSSSSTPSRRVFLFQAAAVGAALGSAASASMAAPAAAQGALLSETDPTAKALKYHSDAKKVNPAANPKYKAGHTCANCMLYKGDGKLGDCSLFPRRKVPAGAWCSAWAKKA